MSYKRTKLMSEEDLLTHPQPAWQRQTRRARLFTISGTIVGVILLGYLVLGFTDWKYTSPTCGNSPAEAKARGCHYEPMLRSWIPDACYTPEPRDEYSPYDDREWFWDRNLTVPMKGADLDKMRNGDDAIGYTKFFHDEHCLYAWRKLAIAVENHYTLVDSKTMSLSHSTHCSKRIARLIYNIGTWGSNDTLWPSSQAPLMYQTCIKLPWKRSPWFMPW